MATESPQAGRCTLNGFLNNYTICVERLDDAVRVTKETDPPPDWVWDALKKGESTAHFTDSARNRAIRAIEQEGLPALESWFLPSLQEARTTGYLEPIASLLFTARRAVRHLKDIALEADGPHDRSYMEARDSAHDALWELDAVRPLVFKDIDPEPAPKESRGAHSGVLTTALPESVRTAWASFERAISANPSLAEATDKQVFEWIMENDTDTRYQRADFDNWSRYLRKARQVFDKSKYDRRAGRTGRSIVNPDGSPPNAGV